MFNLLSLLLLLSVLVGPPIFLHRSEQTYGWPVRYVLSIFPAAYSGIGWILAKIGYGYFACEGGLKNIHACRAVGHDVTFVIEHGFFLMLVFTVVAGPLSLWMLLNTTAKQIGDWHQRQKNSDT